MRYSNIDKVQKSMNEANMTVAEDLQTKQILNDDDKVEIAKTEIIIRLLTTN